MFILNITLNLEPYHARPAAEPLAVPRRPIENKLLWLKFLLPINSGCLEWRLAFLLESSIINLIREWHRKMVILSIIVHHDCARVNIYFSVCGLTWQFTIKFWHEQREKYHMRVEGKKIYYRCKITACNLSSDYVWFDTATHVDDTNCLKQLTHCRE